MLWEYKNFFKPNCTSAALCIVCLNDFILLRNSFLVVMIFAVCCTIFCSFWIQFVLTFSIAFAFEFFTTKIVNLVPPAWLADRKLEKQMRATQSHSSQRLPITAEASNTSLRSISWMLHGSYQFIKGRDHWQPSSFRPEDTSNSKWCLLGCVRQAQLSVTYDAPVCRFRTAGIPLPGRYYHLFENIRTAYRANRKSSPQVTSSVFHDFIGEAQVLPEEQKLSVSERNYSGTKRECLAMLRTNPKRNSEGTWKESGALSTVSFLMSMKTLTALIH